nr:lipase b [Quercus suber]
MFFSKLSVLTISATLYGHSCAIPLLSSLEGDISNAATSVLDVVVPSSALAGAANTLIDDINSIVPMVTVSPFASATDAAGVLSHMKGIRPTASVRAVPDAMRTLSGIYASPTPANIFAAIEELAEAGLTTGNLESLDEYLEGAIDGQNSLNNVNVRNPWPPVYPFAERGDAPYDLSERALRAAIYIPPSFKYGKGAQPIILVPGTGDTGYETFKGNYIPLLQGSTIGDPVWLNIPGQLLNDAQTNAEYVAYAVNYISGISQHRKVAVIAWSQGNINAQWAYKYWPSTRYRVTDHIAFSPDYHGTVLANLIAIPGEPLPPAILQQEYNSKFITRLRLNGGDSAYVPTTTVYSGFFDEIVEPQQGTGASAYLLDRQHEGVSNNEVQQVCAGQAAGGFYLHEGTLYNNLGYALAIDALTHDGPGRASRLNLKQVCALPITKGLDLADVLLTENAIAIAGLSILTYPSPVFVEPPIKSKSFFHSSMYM